MSAITVNNNGGHVLQCHVQPGREVEQPESALSGPLHHTWGGARPAFRSSRRQGKTHEPDKQDWYYSWPNSALTSLKGRTHISTLQTNNTVSFISILFKKQRPEILLYRQKTELFLSLLTLQSFVFLKIHSIEKLAQSRDTVPVKLNTFSPQHPN